MSNLKRHLELQNEHKIQPEQAEFEICSDFKDKVEENRVSMDYLVNLG